MTDLTSTPVRHVAMLTKLLVTLCLLSVGNGKAVSPQQPALEKPPTLIEKINKERCAFPPANLSIPLKCSDFSPSSEVALDLQHIEFYLCIALLDSTERLCHVTKGNTGFGNRVSAALNETLESIMTISDDDTFCKEMNALDPDPKYPAANFTYNKLMRQSHCVTMCLGLEPKEAAQREPLCKSILFAHQQIRVASDDQHKFNMQARQSKQDKDSSFVAKTVKATGSNLKPQDPEESLPVAQSSQKANLQGTPDETRTASNTDTASNSKTSEVQTSTRNQPANPIAAHPVEVAQVEEPNPRLPATAPSKKDNAKSAAEQAPASQVKPNEQGPVVPVETNDNAKASDTETPKTELESPGFVPNSEENTEDMKGEGIQSKNGPADVADGPPQPEDNDEDFNETNNKQEFFEGDDNETPVGDRLQDVGGDVVENKPPPVEKKVSGVPLQLPQQKAPQTSMVGNFEESEDSHFFAYFMSLSGLCILGYLLYHNKRKIIAMAVEGKKGRNTGRRRPNSASYHKLDSNLEEAMSSNLASTNSYVIY